MKLALLLVAAPLMAATTAATIVGPVKPLSFRLDVMPVFFRAGCNSGACHGAAAGKDGFHFRSSDTIRRGTTGG